MPDLIVHPAERPLLGSVPVPADRSIAHRALLVAGLATGRSRLRGGAHGADLRPTVGALRALGVRVDEPSPGELVIEGAGLSGLRAPDGPIDCGGSAATMRLLSGILVAQRFPARLVGDASLSRRPMERVAKPLRLRGGRIEGQLDPRAVGEITAPLDVGPLPEPHVLSSIEHELPAACEEVKSALLLSGLFADGPTFVREPIVSRDHTERLLSALDVPISTIGAMVCLDALRFSGALPAFDLDVPGDISAAAFLVAAAQMVPGSRVTARRVGLNPTRAGLLEVLRDMDGVVAVEVRGDALGEPTGDLHVASGAGLRGGRAGGELAARAIDDLPILLALGARARGVTEVFDAGELRAHETDRLAAMASVLRAFGLRCEERADGLVVEGRPEGPLDAADVDSLGDDRVAMTAAVLGLAARGPTRVRDAGCITTSFPLFVGTLRALGARIEVDSARAA
ncbi:3-phosphoshikimate 1-carboxyvinyltransferase [Sorangium sp. So ce1024]|uniref:3-phosphoshikimate 1-carboxyvinyltransferase n=1 Tax=unclassified Sorangium TaxID=2621164 RepID=UPI003F012DC8